MFENGLTWVKADFHLHTHKDKEFKYSGEENSFVKEYIAQLKSESVSVGVITNHNKFDEGEYKALKKSGRKEGILILPGVELSVKEANGIHTLIAMPGAHRRCMNCRLQALVSVLESQTMRKLWYRPEWKL